MLDEFKCHEHSEKHFNSPTKVDYQKQNHCIKNDSEVWAIGLALFTTNIISTIYKFDHLKCADKAESNGLSRSVTFLPIGMVQSAL